LSPKIVDKEEKKKAIALASVEVFSEKGFDRTRMEDVAKVAGVGKGTIYEYFKTKDELMEGAVSILFSDMMNELMPKLQSDAPATQQLISMLEKSILSIKQVGFAYRFFLDYMIQISRKNSEETFVGEMLAEYRRALAELVRKGVAEGEFRADLDPYEAVAAMAAWIDGAVFHWYTLPNTVSLEAMGKNFIEMILRGLKPRDVFSNQ
jgi:AcrR family transcriptional regulator